MGLPAVPSKVLKSFIGLEESESEPFVRSCPAISKYQSQSHTIRQAVTMCRSKPDQLEEPASVVRSSPVPSKYQQQSRVGQAATMVRSKANQPLPISQSTIDLNSLITLPQNPSAVTGSRASVVPLFSISEDQHDEHNSPSAQDSNNCSDMILRRKGAMKRHYSPWRTTIEIDTNVLHKEIYPLRRTHSADVVPQNTLTPYNPDKPLIKNFPLKKSEIPHLARALSIKTTIGPLTKEVCEQLNIVVESGDHLTKSDENCLRLKVPDHTDEKIFLVEVEKNTSLMSVKGQLINQLRRVQPDNNWDFIRDCQFVYTINGHDYQLLDDYQYICNSFLYEDFLHRKTFPLIEVRKNRLHTEEETLLFDKIHAITRLSMHRQRTNSQDSGVFDATQTSHYEGDKEMTWAKLLLQSFAIEVARYRDPVKYSMLTELDYTPITEHFAMKIPPNNMMTILIHVQKVLTLEKSFSVLSTATDVLTEVFPCLQIINLIHHSKIDNYTLQVTGEENYITGDIRLLDFKAVRRAIFKKQDLHLSVVNKSPSFKDQLYNINWPLVDPFTGTAPTHDYLIALDNSVDTINAISLWDLTFPFKINVKKISNVSQQHYRKDTSVELEVGMYVGGRLLTEAVKTSTTLLKEETTWNEILTFDFHIHAIPKATRLVIIVREDKDKKGKRKSSDATISSAEFYWGAISLIDYRNVLKVGTHEVYMWPASKSSGKDSEDTYYNPNPIGPIANNPDPSAVQLTLEFESWKHPIVFPNDVLETTIAQMPRTLTRDSYENGIGVIAKALKTNEAMVMNLQAYIQKVDWSNPHQVSEAYSLLSNLEEPLPLAVAFNFLDSGCPDEFVRAFAVERLRELQDEELIDYLLQLIQALKFEANHDSTLARFLLERALQNKSVGHFFFWYCRCEAQNPHFTARYNTLLEAYLVGCGKTMLNDFRDQVSTLDYFEMIANELSEAKCQNASDSQRVLKQLFSKHKFPNKTVIPAYCPRLRLGNLEPEKCKVMQSKKMPMWLWMSSVHPTALRPLPHKLIVKDGDDLRQDMLTLQMLTLFDKIWQKDGLDLCLIPYGCVATGPNSGIIEVVKDARTVADISGIRNANKLLQWIKDHQKDQFGEEDQDLVESAINRFVRSCAGYSVATYVLGIGDRHNDNIMVTTSGNLFHIDFGHFLGNVKHFMKIKREWCPFVLTPDFIHVMGGEKSVTFTKFRNLCCKAFMSLRKNADLIINLFSMMRYTGIPELTCVEDIDYLRDALMVTKDDLAAEIYFDKLLNKCIKLGWTVQISWWAHVIKTA